MVNPMNYALLNSRKVITNVIVLDDIAAYTPPKGFTLLPVPESSGAGIGWTYIDGQFVAPAAPEPVPPTADEQRAKRRAAYTAEADPIYFKSQRGEATIEEWEAKIAEIRARYPMPTTDA